MDEKEEKLLNLIKRLLTKEECWYNAEFGVDKNSMFIDAIIDYKDEEEKKAVLDLLNKWKKRKMYYLAQDIDNYVIFDSEKTKNMKVEGDRLTTWWSGEIATHYRTFRILKQSEKIEDLFDEFVRVSKSNHDFLVSDDMPTKKFRDTEIYGAIWTDKGLIYVAKMNENGELELL